MTAKPPELPGEDGAMLEVSADPGDQGPAVTVCKGDGAGACRNRNHVVLKKMIKIVAKCQSHVLALEFPDSVAKVVLHKFALHTFHCFFDFPRPLLRRAGL